MWLIGFNKEVGVGQEYFWNQVDEPKNVSSSTKSSGLSLFVRERNKEVAKKLLLQTEGW